MKFKLALLSLVIINLITLDISPIPWTDEIYSADLSLSLVEQRGYVNTILPTDTPPFVYIYGPVYFCIQAFIIKLFGLHIFSFRFVNLVSAFGIIWILFRYFKVSRFLVLLLGISPLFIQNAHSGRMDLLATFFALAGYVPFATNYEINWRKILITSLFFLLAFLTSPRVGFLFPGLYILFLHQRLSLIDFSLILIPAIIVLIGLFGWSLYTTNNLIGAYSPIFQSNIAQSSDMHVGISFFRGHIDDISSIIFFVFGASFLLKNRSWMVLSMLSNFIVFACFVKEVGPYGAMVLPFIILGLHHIEINNKYFKYSLQFNAAVFLIFFIIKGVVLVDSIPSRNYKQLDNFIKDNIPAGEKVFATNEYYYGLMKNHNHPTMIQFEDSKSEEFILKNQPKYFFVNMIYLEKGKSRDLIKHGNYKVKAKFSKVSVLSNLPIVGLISTKLSVNTGLNGIIFIKK